jgi:hypothetical protein
VETLGCYFSALFSSPFPPADAKKFSGANGSSGWAEKTPKGFIVAAKVPQEITHEKVLVAEQGATE